MHTRIVLCLLAFLALAGPTRAQRERLLMDRGWRFALGHASEAAKDFRFSEGGFSYLAKAGSDAGPIGLGFSDARWRTIDLPHDWAIELPFDPKSDPNHGFKPIGRDFPQNSVGWYRRTFAIAKADEGRRLTLTFDGAFRDARVWVNGHYLGRNESGYTGFSFDISDVVKYGQKNVVAVRVDASEAEGWFYEGAGIYRHVWLEKTAAVHLVPASIAVATQIRGESATMVVRGEVVNDATSAAGFSLHGGLEAPGTIGELAPQQSAWTALAPGEKRPVALTLTLPKARLWSPESPFLYTLRLSLTGQPPRDTRQSFDTLGIKIGIRTVTWDANKGFFLNGKPYKIKGTCNHQDHAGVGAALPDALQDWRIAQLKKMGCNAYRTSHNPPTPELLDACDRLGMLVLDETRFFGSSPAALDQLTWLVKRDRNHASVFFWSIGNEEGATHGTPESYRMAKTMIALIRKLDPQGRLTTYAGNNGGQYEGINAAVDVRGFNYNLGSADGYHRAHPDQPTHGSETASTVSTRGIYQNDRQRGYVSAYDVNFPSWATTAQSWWSLTDARPWLAGGFVWTGFDYRGEPTPYSWPCISSHFGILDVCGFPKDNFYYYRAWWSGQPTTHLFPHWNWAGKEGQPIEVWVHSNADAVELFLNGKSQGRKPVAKNGHLAWSVLYAPGTLEAQAWRAGKPAEKRTIETTGAPAALTLTADRAALAGDGEDALPVTIGVTDPQGRAVATANLPVSLAIEGAGTLLGVGNGDPSCHEPDTFPALPRVRNLSGWKFGKIKTIGLRPLISHLGAAAEFDDSKWPVGNVETANTLAAGEGGIWRLTLELTAEDIAENDWQSLEIGMVDDLGRVTVNNTLVGNPDDWRKSWRFDIRKALKPGKNVIVIAVYNTDGGGGLAGGIRLVGKVQAAWGRSLFNGLAQAIVRAGDTPGELTLTATSPGLAPARLTLPVRRAVRRPEVPVP